MATKSNQSGSTPGAGQPGGPQDPQQTDQPEQAGSPAPAAQAPPPPPPAPPVTAAASADGPIRPRRELPALDEEILKNLISNGDLSGLSKEQKAEYYWHFCVRLGLDPIAQPFRILRLNGKEVLYCDRSGAQQLSRLHNVSHFIMARDTLNGCYVVTARAATPDGRCSESIGAVTIENLRGDSLCNAMMKAETKAKRRATLDLLGLGILDETEIATIQHAQTAAAPIPGDQPNGQGHQQHPAPLMNGNMKEAQALIAQGNIFKRKYDDVDQIGNVLERALDVKDIANLYYVNADAVEGNKKLKARFTSRKNEFFSNNTNAGAPAATPAAPPAQAQR
jgi:hypothetical protein